MKESLLCIEFLLKLLGSMIYFAIDLKLSKMVDKISGQTETFLFILTF